MTQKRMRFGAFIAPHFPADEHPNLAIEEDMDRVVWLEKMGFQEAWIGEHHSGGWEINGSPELFAAAASQRTQTIKFGMGVSRCLTITPIWWPTGSASLTISPRAARCSAWARVRCPPMPT